ncbi:hypothetical protein CA12_27400 [Alienimonas californiensis]|uniref:Uncharacterized protein n=1 Tax=Alienimonas californiensis TaxID=2527989 RepID=A0A517PB72_9PLAN|nr:hypothetical protein CA12_27400 [Alienimonas californiensis]
MGHGIRVSFRPAPSARRSSRSPPLGTAPPRSTARTAAALCRVADAVRPTRCGADGIARASLAWIAERIGQSPGTVHMGPRAVNRRRTQRAGAAGPGRARPQRGGRPRPPGRPEAGFRSRPKESVRCRGSPLPPFHNYGRGRRLRRAPRRQFFDELDRHLSASLACGRLSSAVVFRPNSHRSSSSARRQGRQGVDRTHSSSSRAGGEETSNPPLGEGAVVFLLQGVAVSPLTPPTARGPAVSAPRSSDRHDSFRSLAARPVSGRLGPRRNALTRKPARLTVSEKAVADASRPPRRRRPPRSGTASPSPGSKRGTHPHRAGTSLGTRTCGRQRHPPRFEPRRPGHGQPG